ncbi:MAG: cation:dicarboxylase symporter family transporter, partial [Burkholderiales bacterium]
PPLAFLRGTLDAMLVAFSTSSSSASLPVEMSVAEKNLGIGRPVFSTVLPVGVAIGRDGTAMYVALLSVFGAQALGIPLAAPDLVLILFVSTLIAVSAPPVPSAALFMMSAVLSTIGISDVQAAVIVGFILPFDRFLDMMRTVPNVTSNLTNATIVARAANEIDVEVFKRKPVE